MGGGGGRGFLRCMDIEMARRISDSPIVEPSQCDKGLSGFEMFALRSKSTMAAYLLVMSMTTTLRYMQFITTQYATMTLFCCRYFIFTFGRQASVAASLLVVTRAIAGAYGLLIAIWSTASFSWRSVSLWQIKARAVSGLSILLWSRQTVCQE